MEKSAMSRLFGNISFTNLFSTTQEIVVLLWIMSFSWKICHEKLKVVKHEAEYGRIVFTI